ncbi:hypothetical protein BDV59DRAFT_168160 [Aspergillus ambiguus]|uniref:uncharacterized protein n=1 Tax=Aspergillus ambiguus TaxID=176160 RepID=UPI003CCDE111
MLSPHKNPSAKPSPRSSVPLRGLFSNGVWYCNCPKRLPAAKLETRNHGQNHGKWFYTCQLPPHQRCDFFLWVSDAQAREKMTVLSNSASESSIPGPQTPSKPPRTGRTGLLTPQTERPFRTGPAPVLATPSRSAKARMMSEDTDEFDWGDTVDDDDFEKLLSQPPRQPDFGHNPAADASFASSDFTYSPRKTPRTDSFTSPGKRKFSGMEREDAMTPTSLFSSHTPSQSFPPSSMDISETPTPSKYRNALAADSEDTSELARQVVKVLESHGTVVPRRAMEELTALLNRHDLKMKGVVRGRDISRAAVKKKENEISILNERIASLEAQREMDSSVFEGLDE